MTRALVLLALLPYSAALRLLQQDPLTAEQKKLETALYPLVKKLHPEGTEKIVHEMMNDPNLKDLARIVNRAKCEPLPEDLFWGIYIDGKDAPKGSEAYSWDKDFSVLPMNAVKFLHANVSVGEYSDLTPEAIAEVHSSCCKMFAKRGSSEVMMGHTLDCIDKIQSCEQRMMGSTNIQEGLIKFAGKPDETGCYKDYTRQNPPVDKTLAKMLEKYNAEVHQASTDDQKIDLLANFMRNFAWLHGWIGGNGRIRNFVLQREIRRLGLGCGAMMFNNNRDIFYENNERYAGKIREGIAMYKESVLLKQNAWQVQENRDRHATNFAHEAQKHEVCVMKREKLGSID